MSSSLFCGRCKHDKQITAFGKAANKLISVKHQSCCCPCGVKKYWPGSERKVKLQHRLFFSPFLISLSLDNNTAGSVLYPGVDAGVKWGREEFMDTAQFRSQKFNRNGEQHKLYSVMLKGNVTAIKRHRSLVTHLLCGNRNCANLHQRFEKKSLETELMVCLSGWKITNIILGCRCQVDNWQVFNITSPQEVQAIKSRQICSWRVRGARVGGSESCKDLLSFAHLHFHLRTSFSDSVHQHKTVYNQSLLLYT